MLVTHSTLTVLGLLLAGALAVLASQLLGLGAWGAVPGVPLAWFGVLHVGRRLHSRWVERQVRLERSGAVARPRALPALGVAGRLQAVAGGEAGFTLDHQPLPAVERAVLLPWNATDETAVRAELARADAESLRRIVVGLRAVQDECVEALGRPSHVLFPAAHRLLEMVGHPPTLLFPRLRAEAAWRRRRPFVDPDRPRVSLALRVLLAGMPRAALDLLGPEEPQYAFARRLWRLARLIELLQRGEGGGLALRPEEFARWAPELLMLAGRRLRDLVPGSAFLAAVPGGPVALEEAVRRTPAVVADLVDLYHDCRELERPISLALGQILARPPDSIALDLQQGEVEGRVDTAVQMHLRGLGLLAEGRANEAVAEFEAVRARAPAYPPATYALAVALGRTDRAEEAEELLRRDVEARPDDADARLFLARFLADGGHEDRARAVYDAALTVFPRSAGLRIAYAQDLASWDDEVEAALQLEAAHEDHPEDPRLAFLTGRSRVTAGRADEAIHPLRRACRQLDGRERAEARYWLFSAYRDQGRHDAALDLAGGLVEELGRGQESLLDELGDYLEERHDYLRARAAHDRARRLRGEQW